MPDRSETEPARSSSSNDEYANGSQLRVTEVTCPEQLHPIAERLVSQLHDTTQSDGELGNALDRFLQSLYQTEGPSAIACLFWRDTYIPPRLDLYVIWSSPLTLDDQELEKLEYLTGEHVKHLFQFRESLTCFLEFADVMRYPSPEDLRREFASRPDAAGLVRLVDYVILHS